jgi:hypothetical protein
VSHEQNERVMLVEYQDAAATSPSAAFRYLASLIVEDEVRHHRIFRELASALKSAVEWRPEVPAVPHLGHWGDDTARIVELTERLLQREHADARELHRLAGELRDLEHTTLWALLVRLI